MRRVVGLVIGLFLACWVLSEVPIARTGPVEPRHASHWKRTKDGWERATAWPTNRPPTLVRLHPAVLGSFQLLASLGALIAFPVCPRRFCLRRHADRRHEPRTGPRGGCRRTETIDLWLNPFC